MSTTLAVQPAQGDAEPTVGDEQSLVLPTKREALLVKLDKLKTGNLSAVDLENCGTLTRKTSQLFCSLCRSKLGISSQQLKGLDRSERNELAVVIYERSRISALIQTVILMCIPVVGWAIASVSLWEMDFIAENDPAFQNMRYYWWYRRMKNKYNKVFEPGLE